MADYANILLTHDGAVARLTLNRPERRNALTHPMMLELEDAFGRVRDDPNCRVLVLRGAGGHFSAGGDLDAMADMPPRPADGAADPLVSAYRQFGEALQFRRADDFIGDQHVAHAAFDHRLGFAHFLTAHADRAQRDLLLGDLRTFVTLRMRTQFDRQALERIRQALQIALERVEIEQQAGRVDFGQRHADRGGRTKTHLAATL